MALIFGLLSSITGIFSALVAYFTLRAMRLDSSMYFSTNPLIFYLLQVAIVPASEQPRMLENGLLLRHEHTYRVLRNGVPRRGSTKSRRDVRAGA